MPDEHHDAQAAELAPFGGVLDPATVEGLRVLAEAANPDLLGKLQASFARDTPVRLHALRAAVESGDGEAVAFNIHTIKGSAANLGAIRMVAICREIEGLPGTPGRTVLEPPLRALEQAASDAQVALARLAETN
jgi:HPt (histidine-containing phosphotransfer) domain-containing protein